MEKTPRSRAQRLDAGARRRQIIDATLACFATGGPERWTLRQVSREAGVAPSLITHFFGSWSGLLAAVQEAVGQELESGLAAIVARPGPGAEERLAEWLELCIPDDLLEDDAAGACLAFRALARQEPALKPMIHHALSVMRATLEPVVAALAEERGAGVDAATLADRACCMLIGLRFELSADAGATPEIARAKLHAFVEASLRPAALVAPVPASGVSAGTLQSAPLGDEEGDRSGDAPD